MFREHAETEDLKSEILYLKKSHLSIVLENNTLKVKVRKLQKELANRNKLVENLLDPQKSQAFRRTICDNGASMLLNLKAKNENLEKLIKEKDAQINKLQNQLETAKLYTCNNLCQQKNIFTNCAKSKSEMKLDSNSVNKQTINQQIINVQKINDRKYTCEMTREDNGKLGEFKNEKICAEEQFSLSVVTETALSDIAKLDIKIPDMAIHKDKIMKTVESKDQCGNVSPQHILSIIECMKCRDKIIKETPRKAFNCSPASDLERTDLTSPHEEIQHLHQYFQELLHQVDDLKSNISQLKKDQTDTKIVLDQKNNNIQKLAKEIRFLKSRNSPRRKIQSAYASGSAISKKSRQALGSSSSEPSTRPSSSSSVLGKKNTLQLKNVASNSSEDIQTVKKDSEECPFYKVSEAFKSPCRGQNVASSTASLDPHSVSVQTTIDEQEENEGTTTCDEESVPVL